MILNTIKQYLLLIHVTYSSDYITDNALPTSNLLRTFMCYMPSLFVLKTIFCDSNVFFDS